MTVKIRGRISCKHRAVLRRVFAWRHWSRLLHSNTCKHIPHALNVQLELHTACGSSDHLRVYVYKPDGSDSRRPVHAQRRHLQFITAFVIITCETEVWLLNIFKFCWIPQKKCQDTKEIDNSTLLDDPIEEVVEGKNDKCWLCCNIWFWNWIFFRFDCVFIEFEMTG